MYVLNNSLNFLHLDGRGVLLSHGWKLAQIQIFYLTRMPLAELEQILQVPYV